MVVGAPAAETTPPKLDDVMMAMDVVDTLRHREDFVRRELDEEGREAELIARLREIYHQQGIEVPDHVLKQGVQALKESRFVYTPPPRSWKRTMLELWALRSRVARRTLTVMLIFLAVLGIAYFTIIRPAQESRRVAHIEATETLPKSINLAHSDILAIAKDDTARERANALFSDGQRAVRDGDLPAMRSINAQLGQLLDELRTEYTLRIISQPGQTTGLWRRPPGWWQARSYYLIVEPIAPDGQTLSLPIRDELSGETKTVSQFGVRVPQQTYEAVAADKREHGVVRRNELGVKQRGRLTIDYAMPAEGGTINTW